MSSLVTVSGRCSFKVRWEKIVGLRLSSHLTYHTTSISLENKLDSYSHSFAPIKPPDCKTVYCHHCVN